MEERDSREKEFLEGVWSKVRYLEYKKSSEDRLQERQRNYTGKRVKSAICLLFALVLLSVVFFVATEVNILSLMLLGSAYMAAGLLYETFWNASSQNGR